LKNGESTHLGVEAGSIEEQLAGEKERDEGEEDEVQDGAADREGESCRVRQGDAEEDDVQDRGCSRSSSVRANGVAGCSRSGAPERTRSDRRPARASRSPFERERLSPSCS